jgi:hypothetical protein
MRLSPGYILKLVPRLGQSGGLAGLPYRVARPPDILPRHRLCRFGLEARVYATDACGIHVPAQDAVCRLRGDSFIQCNAGVGGEARLSWTTLMSPAQDRAPPRGFARV